MKKKLLDLQLLADSLEAIKKEIKREFRLFKLLRGVGIDLSNFQDNGQNNAINILSAFIQHGVTTKDNRELSVIKDYIEWWLYDSSPKIIFCEEKEYSVEEPLKLVTFLLQGVEALG